MDAERLQELRGLCEIDISDIEHDLCDRWEEYVGFIRVARTAMPELLDALEAVISAGLRDAKLAVGWYEVCKNFEAEIERLNAIQETLRAEQHDTRTKLFELGQENKRLKEKAELYKTRLEDCERRCQKALHNYSAAQAEIERLNKSLDLRDETLRDYEQDNV